MFTRPKQQPPPLPVSLIFHIAAEVIVLNHAGPAPSLGHDPHLLTRPPRWCHRVTAFGVAGETVSYKGHIGGQNLGVVDLEDAHVPHPPGNYKIGSNFFVMDSLQL